MKYSQVFESTAPHTAPLTAVLSEVHGRTLYTVCTEPAETGGAAAGTVSVSVQVHPDFSFAPLNISAFALSESGSPKTNIYILPEGSYHALRFTPSAGVSGAWRVCVKGV